MQANGGGQTVCSVAHIRCLLLKSGNGSNTRSHCKNLIIQAISHVASAPQPSNKLLNWCRAECKHKQFVRTYGRAGRVGAPNDGSAIFRYSFKVRPQIAHTTTQISVFVAFSNFFLALGFNESACARSRCPDSIGNRLNSIARDCVPPNNISKSLPNRTRTQHNGEKIILHKSRQIHAHKTPYKFVNACIRFLCEKRGFSSVPWCGEWEATQSTEQLSGAKKAVTARDYVNKQKYPEFERWSVCCCSPRVACFMLHSVPHSSLRQHT